MKKTLFLIIGISFAVSAFVNAQILPPDGGESTGDEVLYRNEMHGGAFIHSNGLGLFFRKGKHVTGKRMLFYEIDLTNIKHPKGYKGINPFEERARQYVYGKQNSFAVLRPGIGIQNVLHSKNRRKGVEVRYHSYIGASLGFVKPVYLEIIKHENNQKINVIEKYDPERHHLDNIYGKAPFSKGLGETRLQPGIYGKFGMSFEYSGYDDFLKAIEAGIVVDAYTEKVPLMALTDNNRVFINFYISFLIGKREF
ncbi:MAG: hypothetical protein H0V01_06660 [Bacteroidetes bacterium]|nr:hypothetical protein [Bacteroidota bacterium]HET6245143.1 hypothetical protein [Bacteroidia bacterium]